MSYKIYLVYFVLLCLYEAQKLTECSGKIDKTKYKIEMLFQFIFCLIVTTH